MPKHLAQVGASVMGDQYKVMGLGLRRDPNVVLVDSQFLARSWIHQFLGSLGLGLLRLRSAVVEQPRPHLAILFHDVLGYLTRVGTLLFHKLGIGGLLRGVA